MVRDSAISLNELEKYLKNRYPYLMIDRITKIIPGEIAEGFKNLSNNEWFFPCHYKDYMNMPGTLQLEALVEIFVISVMSKPEYEGGGIRASEVRLDNVRFHKEIFPGDCLYVVSHVESCRRGIAKGKAIGYVDEKKVCEAEITIAIPDIVDRLVPREPVVK